MRLLALLFLAALAGALVCAQDASSYVPPAGGAALLSATSGVSLGEKLQILKPLFTSVAEKSASAAEEAYEKLTENADKAVAGGKAINDYIKDNLDELRKKITKIFAF